jgi:hypothetical protein
VGAFLEGGSKEEFAALKELARMRPQAPPAKELAAAGTGFALHVQTKAAQ